jgi:triacylglycerol lipase
MGTYSRRFATSAIALCLTLAGALWSVGDATAAPRTPLHVPYNFLVDAIPGSFADTPPGTNNWRCKPPKAHPEPVILVHGFAASRGNNWQTYGPLLFNHGYCVFAVNYGGLGFTGGYAAMELSARELGAFVQQVLRATGAKKVTLIGHSEGATMPLGYLKFEHGNKYVSKMIGLAGVAHGWGGVDGVRFPQIGGGNEPAMFGFMPTSAFIQRLNRGGITQPGTQYTQIVTRYDDVVLPWTSGIIREPGAVNIIIQDPCANDLSDHLSIVSDPNVAHFVLKTLDPSYDLPLRCTPVYPVFGVMPGTPIPPGISAPLPS